MVEIPSGITDITDLASYSERQQIEWMTQSYQNEQTGLHKSQSVVAANSFGRLL